MKVIGISGPSCSGKSTLARHLRHVLTNAAVLYEDDFYFDEHRLPKDYAGRPNWDCPKSFDLEAMRARILEIKESNKFPSQETREEYNNNSGTFLISQDEISCLKSLASHIMEPVLLVDGIYLFHEGSEVADLFDVKVLYPCSYSTLKQRRESRKGYATSDGFWVDPPNFFDDVVWPEFLKHSQHLYDSDGEHYTRLSDCAKKSGLWMPSTIEDMKTIIEGVIRQIQS